MSKFSSVTDVGSRKTSSFNPKRKLWGVVSPHAGTDYAPKKPGQPDKVYAAADGTVTATGVGVLAGHSGQIVVIDHGTLTDKTGSDWVRTNYGHLSKILVKTGQKVKAGDLIGLMGMTGKVTGVHLHFGVRFGKNYSDPHAWLLRKGITVGKTAPVKEEIKEEIKPATPKPPVAKPPVKPAVKPPVVPSKPPVPSQTTLKVQKRLKAMGYTIKTDGVNDAATKAVIKEYQKSQKAPYKLVDDGVWGRKTEDHYQWVLGFQKKINGWKSKYKKLTPDGHYGANTVARVLDIQKRNLGTTYKATKATGVPGRVFCDMIDYKTHP